MEHPVYDLIIVGGGPAGLTAGLYARRSRLNTLLIEKLIPGGQVLTTDWVDNYPGFPEGISGFDLVEKMRRQTERFELPVINDEILSLSLQDPDKIIKGTQGTYTAKALIIASGAAHKKLGVPGEDLLGGKGVSYCATCDGPFFRDQEIAVVGGGDTAVQEALYLTRFAKKIYLIHRRDQLRATRILQEKALAHTAIQPVWNSMVESIQGTDQVEGVSIKNKDGSSGRTLSVEGVFILVGTLPNTEWLKPVVPLDPQGFIQTDPHMATPIPGIFAAGDVRQKLLRQISTAVGDGATAVFAAERYLEAL
ncbi:MAG: thioredoxin-disulfide reductase [Deltaproteobacteria bacterium RBG_13_43_22]|nr:MAG: thioredoxin-disulfide reductase [Deltaproteobacteria bacterium RBG_13_43_22]